MKAADELRLTDSEKDEGIEDETCDKTRQTQSQQIDGKGDDAEEEEGRADKGLRQRKQQDDPCRRRQPTNLHAVVINALRQQK
jgi:hypothetical protein